VSYIDDIINETLRLKPPVVQGSPRETPAQGTQIGGVYIPGNTNVSVPFYLIQRDERWWKQPDDFVPERWGEKREEMGTDGAPFLPFSQGRFAFLHEAGETNRIAGLHTCVGKNLAYMELRMVVSAILQNFDVDFAPGETGKEFDEGFKDSFIMMLLPLNLRFTPRA
jgi:cytochrome P450